MPKYVPSQSVIEAVKSHLLKLKHMNGFPPDDGYLDLIAKAVASFSSVEEVDHSITDESGKENHKMSKGKVVPIEWLVEEIAKTCFKFPMPIAMRIMYEKWFPPLDGWESGELIDR
jgi:hypothetical protein